MAGGQPLFGNTQEIHTNLQAKVSLKYQKREVVKKNFVGESFSKFWWVEWLIPKQGPENSHFPKPGRPP